MALTRTTLAAAVAANDLTIKVTSATGATVGGVIWIDNDYAVIVAITGTVIEVRSRGSEGGIAAAHNALAGVTFGLGSDFPARGAGEITPLPTDDLDIVAIGANGVIPVPVRNTLFFINKASALASSTFADPTKAQDGLTVTFVGTTDYAHVVTTVTVHDGTTGLHTTLTSPAFIGGALTLVAYGGKWLVKKNQLWVIT